MEEEIIACIQEKNIKFLHSGQISKYIVPLSRQKAHELRMPHLIVRLFIMAFAPNNQVFYLIQKRGKNRISNPGLYTDSASGHIIYQEGLNMENIKENAIRELEEEFGISPDHVKKIIFSDLNIENDIFTTEIAYIFFGLVDLNTPVNPSEMELDVTNSKFYSKEELEEIIINKKEFVEYAKDIWKLLLITDIKELFKDKIEIQEKKRKSALFIGRFQPFHKGHLYVITNILTLHEKIKIGIGSSQLSHSKNDPFTSEERRQFIEASLQDKGITPAQYEIFEIPDIFNAKKWVDHVISIVGDVDIIYSNSEWVRELFQNKGFKLGDKLLIEMEKYNATNIRYAINSENEVWQKLVPRTVSKLIKEINGVQRIQTCFKKEKN